MKIFVICPTNLSFANLRKPTTSPFFLFAHSFSFCSVETSFHFQVLVTFLLYLLLRRGSRGGMGMFGMLVSHDRQFDLLSRLLAFIRTKLTGKYDYKVILL